MGLLIAVLNLILFGLILYLCLLLVEWIIGMFFPIPANILQIVRAIFGLIFLIYAITLLLGAAQGEPGIPMLFDWRHR